MCVCVGIVRGNKCLDHSYSSKTAGSSEDQDCDGNLFTWSSLSMYFEFGLTEVLARRIGVLILLSSLSKRIRELGRFSELKRHPWLFLYLIQPPRLSNDVIWLRLLKILQQIQGSCFCQPLPGRPLVGIQDWSETRTLSHSEIYRIFCVSQISVY